MRRGPVENVCSINMRVSIKSGRYIDSHGREQSDREMALRELVDTLRALGLDVQRDKSQLTIAFPTQKDAERLRSRGGGRPRKYEHDHSHIADMEDGEDKDLAREFARLHSGAEYLAFFEKHGAAKTATAMGVSQATVYRRLPSWREQKRIEDLCKEYDSLPVNPIDDRLDFLKKQKSQDVRRLIPNARVSDSWPHNSDDVEIVKIFLNADATHLIEPEQQVSTE